MKREEIKVGAKSKSAREQIKLQYNRPENVADCLKLCQQSEAVIASLFNRGLTIWLQDRFGRPMFEAGAPAAEIQKTFDTAVPGVTKGVGTPKEPITVAVPRGRKLSAEEITALLAAKGIKVVLGE